MPLSSNATRFAKPGSKVKGADINLVPNQKMFGFHIVNYFISNYYEKLWNT